MQLLVYGGPVGYTAGYPNKEPARMSPASHNPQPPMYTPVPMGHQQQHQQQQSWSPITQVVASQKQ